MYKADAPKRKPVPTTTTVPPRFRPTPTGPVQFGARVKARGFNAVTLTQEPIKPLYRRENQ